MRKKMTGRTNLPALIMMHKQTNHLMNDLWRTLKKLPDHIDELKTCSHASDPSPQPFAGYDEDIGNFIRRHIGVKEKL